MTPTNAHQQSKILADITYIIAGVIYAPPVLANHQPQEHRSPLAEATVEIKDHARRAQTDRQGRFRFSNMTAGHYTLLVTAKDGTVGAREIQVPPTYDVELKPTVVVGPTTGIQPSVESSIEPSADPEILAEKPKRSRSKKKADTAKTDTVG